MVLYMAWSFLHGIGMMPYIVCRSGFYLEYEFYFKKSAEGKNVLTDIFFVVASAKWKFKSMTYPLMLSVWVHTTLHSLQQVH